MPVDISALDKAKLFERFNSEPDLWWAVIGAEKAGASYKVFVQSTGDTSFGELTKQLKNDQVR